MLALHCHATKLLCNRMACYTQFTQPTHYLKCSGVPTLMPYWKPVVQVVHRSFYTRPDPPFMTLSTECQCFCLLQMPELQACRVLAPVLEYCMLKLLPHANARAASTQCPCPCSCKRNKQREDVCFSAIITRAS